MIDTPRWRWRGHLWAHLISDSSLDELHEAARTLGLRWLSFGRDHYDVPDTLWAQACELAELVDSRDIVRSLRANGLRVGGGKPQKAWQRSPMLPSDVSDPSVDVWMKQLAERAPGAEVEFLARPGEVVVLHLYAKPESVELGPLSAPPVAGSRVIETVADGRYSLELVLPRPG
ncbi:MAG: DUF4031 domain-containing protein [Actinomycetota bacterium]